MQVKELLCSDDLGAAAGSGRCDDVPQCACLSGKVCVEDGGEPAVFGVGGD